MNKLVRFLSGFIVLAFVLAVCVFLNKTDIISRKNVENKYRDDIGNIYGSTEKNQGIILQSISAQKDDNLFIFGSSELGTYDLPFHPANFFANKRDGFQVNLIGRGYSQSIIHTLNIGALGNSLKGKKIVLIISPQWFSKKGLEPANFNMNFSELQFYQFMFDKDIDSNIKLEAARRIRRLAGENQEFGHIKIFCDLYSMNNKGSKLLLDVMMPYYKFKYYLLSIKDGMSADKMLSKYENDVNVKSQGRSSINWTAEIDKALQEGKSKANNNDFFIENGYYDQYIRDKLTAYKDSYKGQSYTESPEYDDLRVFLDACKSIGVKPLVVSVPVNGKWYDYCGFDKDNRAQYYKKVKELVTSYGYEIADFSGHEYDEYFLKDIMHLGWKGWVYVNEAIDKYYYKD